MKVEHCPVIGDFCITTFSRPHFDTKHILYPKDIPMTQPIAMNTNAAICNVDVYIQSLQTAVKSLRRINGHPPENTFFGVRLEDVQNLEVVCARIEKTQRDCFDPTLDTTAKNEADLAQKMLKRMAPLADRARTKSLSAEKLVEAINTEIDPALARLQFMAHGKNLSAVYDEEHVVMAPATSSLPTHYNSTKSYDFKIKVVEFNAMDRTATFLVIEALSEQPFFRENEHHRHALVSIPLKNDQVLIGLAASLGVTVAVRLALNLNLGKRGFQFSGNLVCFVDKATLTQDIHAAITDQTVGLF
jgi:hypothetical protein